MMLPSRSSAFGSLRLPPALRRSRCLLKVPGALSMPEESNHTRTTEQDRRSAHELALRVLTAASNLPKEVALLPGDEPVRESIVRDILDMESTYEPESAAPTTPLEGRWALRFASNGTVVTRPLAAAGSALSRASDVSSSSLPPGVTIEDIVQTISATPTTTRVTNEATVSVGPISFRIVAEGPWEVSPSASSPSSSESESKLYFDEARFQVLGVFGTSTESWPQLPSLPIPFGDMNKASWTTTYLDERVRVQRANTSGNLFVFEREE